METISNLDKLEAESIHIFREMEAECKNPVLLFSAGKDSAVLLHLAQKAFYPNKLPFPLLHIDTTWKFREMISYRDKVAKSLGLELLIYTNNDALEKGASPFGPDTGFYTSVMKTETLKMAIDENGFDAAFCGARRDEEMSRAKERVCSFRSKQHRWEPRDQRPEPWQLYNTRLNSGESLRVFPLSNWTELDIWSYISRENIEIPELYFAKDRPCVERDGNIIVLDDDRYPLKEGEVPTQRQVRFRSLGCYPLAGAILSEARCLEDIIKELKEGNISERSGRLIDLEKNNSMEKKKKEGYF